MKAIFIDIDNTILSFDEYVKNTMQTGFKKYGLKLFEPQMQSVFNKINNRLWKMIEDKQLTFEELSKIRWNTIFDALEIDFDGVVFEKYFRDSLYDSAIPVDGAYDMLDYLKGKYVLCAASNGPFEQQIHRLKLANMHKYFDCICISERAGAAKPSEKFFDYAFEKLNEGRKDIISPNESVIIGDSLTSDIEGGIRYGMKTCLYSKKLKNTNADWEISRLEQIKDIL